MARRPRRLSVGLNEPQPTQHRACAQRLAADDQQPVRPRTPAGIHQVLAGLERRPPGGVGRKRTGGHQPHHLVDRGQRRGALNGGARRPDIRADVRQAATVGSKRQARAGDVGEHRLQPARARIQAPGLQLAAGRQRDGQTELAVIEQPYVGQRGARQGRSQPRQAWLAAPQCGVQARAFGGHLERVLAVQAVAAVGRLEHECVCARLDG